MELTVVTRFRTDDNMVASEKRRDTNVTAFPDCRPFIVSRAGHALSQQPDNKLVSTGL